MKIVRFIVLATLGALAIIAGEADDSPGLQGLGLILIIFILIRTFGARLKK